MAWLAVTKRGREFISMCKPTRVSDKDNYYGWTDSGKGLAEFRWECAEKLSIPLYAALLIFYSV